MKKRPLMYFFGTGKDNDIIIKQEELEKFITDSYDRGYEDGQSDARTNTPTQGVMTWPEGVRSSITTS